MSIAVQGAGVGDAAAQWQQVPTVGRDIRSCGLSILDQAVEIVEILARLSLINCQKPLAQLRRQSGWHNCHGSWIVGYWEYLPSIRIRDDLNEIRDWAGLCWSLYIVIVTISHQQRKTSLYIHIWGSLILWQELSTAMKKPFRHKARKLCPRKKMLQGHKSHFKHSTLGLVSPHLRREGRGKRAKQMGNVHVLILHGDGGRDAWSWKESGASIPWDYRG